MSNSDIAEQLEFTGKLLTLHDLDENKAKLYGSLAFSLDKLEEDLAAMDELQLLKVRGIGKSLVKTIQELIERGSSTELEELIAQTPEGVLDMFRVKGLGVKKIKSLWQEYGIDNLNDLQIACESGKIAGMKGFGEKTQQSILDSLAFIKQESGKLRMDQGRVLSTEIIGRLKAVFEDITEVGAIPRNLETVDALSFLTASGISGKNRLPEEFQEDMSISSPFVWRGSYLGNQIPVEIRFTEKQEFGRYQILSNASPEHLNYVSAEKGKFLHLIKRNLFDHEAAYYESFGSNFIVPEMREGIGEFEWAMKHQNEELISWDSLKGCLHNHSKYSDGKNTLKEMADACKQLGFEYFGIADHSQTAAYANGLIAGRVVQQQAEIDSLNAGYESFKILKGIESDILSDGSLDYENDILATFDYVVASVHANLDMDETRATARLVRAIENPYTTILGHPTGRLLLTRKGYPVDYKKIIDACAANKVVMEINASPYRLDLDWRWIPYCLEKGVMLSINPDAHKIEGIQDMHYGIAVARKAGLTREMTFNAMPLAAMKEYLKSKRG
jgi:DNA polymerase (family 10)